MSNSRGYCDICGFVVVAEGHEARCVVRPSADVVVGRRVVSWIGDAIFSIHVSACLAAAMVPARVLPDVLSCFVSEAQQVAFMRSVLEEGTFALADQRLSDMFEAYYACNSGFRYCYLGYLRDVLELSVAVEFELEFRELMPENLREFGDWLPPDYVFTILKRHSGLITRSQVKKVVRPWIFVSLVEYEQGDDRLWRSIIGGFMHVLGVRLALVSTDVPVRELQIVASKFLSKSYVEALYVRLSGEFESSGDVGSYMGQSRKTRVQAFREWYFKDENFRVLVLRDLWNRIGRSPVQCDIGFWLTYVSSSSVCGSELRNAVSRPPSSVFTTNKKRGIPLSALTSLFLSAGGKSEYSGKSLLGAPEPTSAPSDSTVTRSRSLLSRTGVGGVSRSLTASFSRLSTSSSGSVASGVTSPIGGPSASSAVSLGLESASGVSVVAASDCFDGAFVASPFDRDSLLSLVSRVNRLSVAAGLPATSYEDCATSQQVLGVLCRELDFVLGVADASFQDTR